IADSAARFELRESGPERWALILSGRLDARSTTDLWKDIKARLRQKPPSALEVDASGIEYCDGAGLSLLHLLSMGGFSSSQAKATVGGLRPDLKNLLKKSPAEYSKKTRPPPPQHTPLAEDVGRAAVAAGSDVKAEVSFIGEVSTGLTAN